MHTLCTRTHQMCWVCVIILNHVNLITDTTNRQHSCCYNAHLRVVPMAFVVHFILLVFLFKLAIIDENSSIALNICSWSALLHYVWLYLFAHLSARWMVGLFTHLHVHAFVHSYVYSFRSSLIDSFTFVAFSDESQHQLEPSFDKKKHIRVKTHFVQKC